MKAEKKIEIILRKKDERFREMKKREKEKEKE